MEKYRIRFEENMKLVGYVMSNFNTSTNFLIDIEDIKQEGYMGLWEACLGFDESKGYQFSTYAISMIKGRIRSFISNSELLHTPRSHKEIRTYLHKHNQDIEDIRGIFSDVQIDSYASLTSVSLTEDISMLDVVDEENNISDSLDRMNLENLIDKLLGYVIPTRRDLMRYWLESIVRGRNVNQSDVARKFKISRQRVSAIIQESVLIFRKHREEILMMLGI